MPNPASSSINACLLPRGVLHISGDDRSSFLQGLVSNDLALCVPNRPLYAAMLTPQGKFLHEFFIYHAGDSFLLDCELERADDLLQRLKLYVLRAKVVLTDVRNEYGVWALFNTSAPHATLPLAGGVGGGHVGRFPSQCSTFDPDIHGLRHQPSPTPPASGRGFISTDPRLTALGARGILPKSAAPEGYTIVDATIYDSHRLALGIADGSRDLVVSSSTLLDANFDLLNGISWTKGCYIGQELTARMHHRALIKKRMFPVTITGKAPAAGSQVFYKGAEVGEMRSSCGNAGLALLNVDAINKAIERDDVFDCVGASLTPHWPTWLTV